MSSFLSWSETLHQRKNERAWEKKEMARKKLWKENTGKKKSNRKEPNWKAPHQDLKLGEITEAIRSKAKNTQVKEEGKSEEVRGRTNTLLQPLEANILGGLA